MWFYSLNTASEVDVLLTWSTKNGAHYATVPTIVLVEEAYLFLLKRTNMKTSQKWQLSMLPLQKYVISLHTVYTHMHTYTRPHSHTQYTKREKYIIFTTPRAFFYSIIEFVILALYILRKVTHASVWMNIHTVYVLYVSSSVLVITQKKEKRKKQQKKHLVGMLTPI